MSDLVRKQIYITRAQENLLKQKAAQLGVSEAEIVREALDNRTCNINFPRRSAEKWREEACFARDRVAMCGARGNRNWKRDSLYDRKSSD